MKAITLDAERQMHLTPDSGIIVRNNPWFVPEDSAHWECHPLVGVRIDRLGMHIDLRFARRYYNSMVVATHQRAVHDEAASAEWLRDGALAMGTPVALGGSDEVLALDIAGLRLDIPVSQFEQLVNAAIEYISRFVTLRTGDLVLLPIGAPALPVREGTDFDCEVNGDVVLKFKTR